MRTLVIKEETTADALSARVLSARLSAAQSEAALQQLQEFNPHVDLAALRAGTVLLIPDAPGFKVSTSEGVFDSVLEDFERMLKGGLDAAAARSKAATEARLAESAEVAKTLKSAPFKRLTEQDPELLREAELANAAIKKEKQEADEALQALANTTKDALAALRSMM